MEEKGGKTNFYYQLSAFVVVCFVLFFAINISQASATSLYLTPSTGNYSVGSNLSVTVYINSADQSMNACSGQLTFPVDKLEVTSISKTGSIIVFWAQEPSFSDDTGKISFEGVILTANGYTGSAGKVLTINFKVKAAGQANVAFIGGAVLANDGLGTNILTSMGSAKYILGATTTVPTAPSPAKPETPTGTGQIAQPVEEEEPEATGPTSGSPQITSTSHPDEETWYNNNEAIFAWDLPRQASGVSLLLNDKPTSNPGPNSDGLFAGKKYSDLADGIHYFHLKIKDNNVWSEISHYKIQIDTTPPEPFVIVVDQDTEGHSLISFATTDALSGIDKYRVKVDNEYHELSAEETTMDLSLPVGNHTVIVRAVDKAGNEAVAAVDLDVAVSSIPAITIAPHKLQTTDKLFLGGTGKPGIALELVVQSKDGQEIVRKIFMTDQDGTWDFVYDNNLAKGDYVAWIKQAESDQPESSVEFLVGSSLISRLSNTWLLFLIIIVGIFNIAFIILALWLYITRSHLMNKPAKAKVKYLLEDDLLDYHDLIDKQMARLDKIKDARNSRLARAKVKHELKAELQKIEHKIVKKIHRF